MSIFSAIGHAVSSGFHDVFGGGNSDDAQKKKKQQQQAAQAQAASQRNNSPARNNDNPNPSPAVPLSMFSSTTPLQKINPKPTAKPAPAAPKAAPKSVVPIVPPPPGVGVAGQPLLNLTKLNPTMTPVAPAPATGPPKKHASIIHDLTHNVVTNVGGDLVKLPVQFSEDYSNTFANLGNKLAGGKDATIQQNMGGDPVSNSLLKLSGATGKNKQLAGDAAQIVTTAIAPGVESVVGDAASKLVPEAATPLLTKLIPKVATGSTLGAAFGAEGTAGEGGNLKQVLKSAGEGALIGGALPVAGTGLRKLIKGPVDGGPPVDNEVTPGVHTVNPNHDADVLAQSKNSPVNNPDLQVAPPPEAQISPLMGEETLHPAQAEELGLQGSELDTPTYQRKGLKLPGEGAPDIATINDQLHENAAAIVKEPAAADMVSDAFRTTGTTNPLSMVMHTLTKTTDKGAVRHLVQKLVPDATGNTLNRAVNEIIGSDNQADVAQALTEATARAKTPAGPLGPVSTEAAPAAAPAEAPAPTPTAVPELAPPVPAEPAAVPPAAPVVPAEAPAVPATPAAELQPAVAPPEAAPAKVQSVAPDVTGKPANPGLKNERFNNAVITSTKNPTMRAAMQSDPIEKDGAPLSAVNDAAMAKVQKMSLPELAANYGKDFKEGEKPVGTVSQYYEHLQALNQLEEHAGDPVADNAAANALAAINDFAYDHGRGLAATKVAYDNLPASMKVAYINKLVEKGGGEISAADQERLLTLTKLQGKFAKTAADAEAVTNELSTHKDEVGADFNAKMKVALANEKKAQGDLYDQNRAVVDILDSNLPKSSLGQRIAQSARTSMLSSIGGRGFALINTAASTAAHISDDTASSIFAHPINAFNKLRGNNAPLVKTSFINPVTLVKGAGSGAKQLVKDVYGKAQPVKSVEDHVRGQPDGEYSHDNTRYGFIGNHITAPLRKIVRVGVGSHLALTKGVEDASLESSAKLAAKEAGVPKENVKGFTDYYKAHPPKAVADEAKQAHLGVNNLHRNGVSEKLGKLADILGGGSKDADTKAGRAGQAVAKQIRTVIIPFSHYMGGFVDKALTDRNVFYNAYKIATAGSPQELSDQLGHAVTNVGAGAGLGYLLAKNGTITTKDQDGNDYDGMYFHIGNKYVPLEIAGQFTAPIVMGAQLHNSLNDKSHGASWPAGVVDTMLKSSGVAGTFGDQNSLNTLLAGDSESAVPKTLGSSVRQHIPGVTGDINAIIDGTKANPTHEAPLTKVTKTNPATGRDITDQGATQVAKTKALIPGLAQKLPRKTGEAAKTETDRILHAGEASGSQLQKVKDDAAQAVKSKSDADQGIPDPKAKYKDGDSFDNAVENRIEGKKYDQAIKGLQQQLDVKTKQKDSNSKETDPIKEKIGQVKALKSGNFDPAIRDTYSKTSVSEWRDLGDPESDTYDPKKYQQLFDYDNALAQNGASGNTNDKTDNKYTAKAAKKSGSGSGSSKESAALKKITSNTLGELPNISNYSSGDLAPKKIDDSNATIPTIQDIPANQLIKKRAISVGKG